MNQEIVAEKMAAVERANVLYVTAFNEMQKNTAEWNQLVISHMSDGTNSNDAWWKAAATVRGKELLAIGRTRELDQMRIGLDRDLAYCALKAQIEMH